MPESAIAEPPPQTAEPTAKEIHLKSLFDIPSNLVDDPPETTEAPDAPETPAKPKVEPEAAAATLPKETKKDDLTSRLAPDFAALETAPVIPAAPDPDLAEIDAAIEQAQTAKKKADLRKFRDQLATLKTENLTLKSRPVVPTDDPEIKTVLDMTTKERDEALSRLERYDLQASPAFQEKYMKPRQQKFDDAYRLVKDAGGDADALGRAMPLVGAQRIEALEEIARGIQSPMMRGRFERLIEGIESDSRVINEKLANAKQFAQEEAKNETIRRHEDNEKMAKEWVSLLGAARSDLLENIKLETLQKVNKPEFEWWDNQVDEIDAVAQEILLKSSPQKAAIAAYLAASAGPLRSMWQAERKRANALDKENRELKGADPKLGQDRIATKVEGDGVAPDDILSRLRTGAYRK